MAYLKIDRVEYNDGTNPANSMYEFDTLDKAVAKSKQEVGNWMQKDACASVGVEVIDTNGFISRYQDFWKRAEEE